MNLLTYSPTQDVPQCCKCAVLLLLLLAGRNSFADEPVGEPSLLEKSLAIDYWDESRFAKFTDGLPLTVDELSELRQLVARLGNFDRRVYYASPSQPVTSDELVGAPRDYRGKFIRWQGEVTRHESPVAEPGSVHRTWATGPEGECLIYSQEFPDKIDLAKEVNRQIAVEGLLVKLVEQDGRTIPIIAAAGIEWFPQQWNAPEVNYGMSVLGVMEVDVSLLDRVTHRQPLTQRETAAFYKLLSSMRETPANELVHWAQRQLPRYRAKWQEQTTEGDKAHQAVARQVTKLAKDNRYAVAPYFNLPQEQVGELVVLDGIVRRALRVEVADDLDAAACGLDHYYELALFTDDSQNNPLMFSVLDLPEGFPVGEDIREPVRIAGFFFKNWRYSSRASGEGGESQLRLAPLFVGRGPLTIVEPPAEPLWGWIGGLGFVLLLLVVWLSVWLRSRADRQFEATTLARLKEPPEKPEFDEQLLSDQTE